MDQVSGFADDLKVAILELAETCSSREMPETDFGARATAHDRLVAKMISNPTCPKYGQ